MTTAAKNPTAFDVDSLRVQFPLLHQEIHGHPLAYLDNAATAQKPVSVLETLDDYYRRYNSNVHRGLHAMAEEATQAYEQARLKVARFLGAAQPSECVFVRGATEGINLVAQSYARPNLGPGDRVLVTQMEHHSNLVPWQMVCEQTGATLDYVPITDTGELDMDAFRAKLDERVKLVACVWISNALGTVNPVNEIITAAHGVGAKVLLDACQAAPHVPIDVGELGVDFLAISGHKMFGPTGIGVLYGRADLLADMPPYQGGGEMIARVTLEKTTYADPPHRFEAGTPHIAGVIGLGAAVDFMGTLDMAAVAAYEHNLLAYGTEQLSRIDGLRLIGTAKEKASILGFVIDAAHAYDLGPVLDRHGVAVRTGHHCAEPVMDRFGVPATVRASLAFYNTRAEIDQLVAALEKAKTFF